jgi:hypothetical protein
LDEGELAGSVDGNEEVGLSFCGLQLGDVEMEETDRVRLELSLDGPPQSLWRGREEPDP